MSNSLKWINCRRDMNLLIYSRWFSKECIAYLLNTRHNEDLLNIFSTFGFLRSKI